LNMVAEGYNASRSIHNTNCDLKVNIPIADCIYEILWEHLPAAHGFKKIESLLV
jgi:glycerol-3-phosphate dehydrogenase (NAD(P)+)